MSLIEKLRKSKMSVLAGTIGLSSLFYAGCDTIESGPAFDSPATFFNLFSGVAQTRGAQFAQQGDFERARRADISANILQTQAVIAGQKEAAEAGRSQVNVYTGSTYTREESDARIRAETVAREYAKG